jgi:hypothetical protein
MTAMADDLSYRVPSRTAVAPQKLPLTLRVLEGRFRVEQRLSGSDAEARVRTSREHSLRASPTTLLIAGREQCLLALAGRKADQPTERDMAEQHKPGEKVHLQGGERRRRRLRLRSDVCRRRAFSPNAQRQGCALRVGSRRDALAQAQRAWQRRQVGISRQQDGIVTRRTKRLDHETPGAAASHRAGCRHRREGHVL